MHEKEVFTKPRVSAFSLRKCGFAIFVTSNESVLDASRFGHLGIVKQLVALGLNVNHKSDLVFNLTFKLWSPLSTNMSACFDAYSVCSSALFLW